MSVAERVIKAEIFHLFNWTMLVCSIVHYVSVAVFVISPGTIDVCFGMFLFRKHFYLNFVAFSPDIFLNKKKIYSTLITGSDYYLS